MFKNAKINLLIASLFSISAYAADLTTDKIEVISATPLPGFGIELNKIPANVQNVKAADIKKSQSLDITDYMNHNLTGVYINEIQNNPLQPDVNYRGFTASPLLGTPQGISVYMDGVRMNQAFGDIVSWDLIPKNAISSMQLMPGSNPLFGLNTLGGALSIQTKDGRSNPGGAIELSAGSYARKKVDFEYGGVSKDNSIDYFVAGSFFDENGWRQRSPSDSQQLFGKLGWRGEKTDLKLTYSLADTDLTGNGFVPMNNREKYSSIFTSPDNTRNNSNLLNLQINHYLSNKLSFSGNAYYKQIKQRTINGDINDESMPEIPGGYGQSIGTIGTTCQTNINNNDEPGEKCTGMMNRTQTITRTAGAFGQINLDDTFFNRPNKLIVGGGYEASVMHFNLTSQYGDIINRELVQRSAYANGGIGSGDMDGLPDNRSVQLRATNKVFSLFASNNLEVTDRLALNASARFNRTRVDLTDKLNPAGSTETSYDDNHARSYTGAAGNASLFDLTSQIPNSLSGSHLYTRINPSVGLTFAATPSISVYGNYNEGSRAPTAIELGCADPSAPCRLPNAMAADPHLKQVVSRTWEGGLRGNYGVTNYKATVYNTRNEDDILFVGTGSASGYFKNFGETNRRGLEAAFTSKLNNFNFGANYAYIDATYESEGTLPGNFNNSGQEVTSVDRQSLTYSTTSTDSYNQFTPTGKDINVSKGDKIPLIPKNVLKAFGSYDFNDKFSIGGDAMFVSGSYVRGNENNQHQPGTVTLDCKEAIAEDMLSTTVAAGARTAYSPGKDCNANNTSSTYRGVGKLASYTLLNLFASYKPQSDWTIFGRINNVFDREYYTAGALGADPFNSSGSIQKAPSGNTSKSYTVGDTLVAPGAPRSAWVGVRWEFK
jgi:outer membrane receptor protein involved in Fe transport